MAYSTKRFLYTHEQMFEPMLKNLGVAVYTCNPRGGRVGMLGLTGQPE